MSSKLDKSTKVHVKVSPKSQPKKPADQLQGRDTVYVDTDDDITSIISKIKSSESTAIALVPPKRTGALQSVVNLKLLQQAAKNNRKKVALITTDTTLLSLSATLGFPVARNLTEQPKLLEAPDTDENEDNFIDGSDIAVGELAKIGHKNGDTSEDRNVSAAVKAIETDDRINNDLDADGEPDDKPQPIRKDQKNRKIPNFDSFRKKLLIFGGLGLACIGFLIWAIWFAPNGLITISAKTSAKNYKVSVTLDPSASTNIDKAIIQPVVKQTKKTETVSFAATGSKEVGEKATGKVVIYNNYNLSGFTLPAGTVIATSGGLQYTLSSAVLVPGMSGSNIDNIRPSASSPVAVEASNIGDRYNVDSGTTFSVSGQSSRVYAVAKGDFDGGSKETVKVVQQSDLDAVVDKLKEQADSGSVKSDLTSQMGSNVTVIPDSFAVNYADATSKPAIGEAVSSDTANATMEITYTMIGITTNDLESLATSQAGALIEDDSSQKVYDNGVGSIRFSDFAVNGASYALVINSSAKIGPIINASEIKERALGKQSGEIISDIESISGVSGVQVRFSPFWVSSISDQSKLKVEFTVDE